MKADKECSKCEETKALTEFHKDKTKKDGHYPSCKICRSPYPWDIINKRRGFYYCSSCREYKSRHAYYFRSNGNRVGLCVECSKQAVQKWRICNVDKVRAYSASYEVDKEKRNQKRRERYAKNPKKYIRKSIEQTKRNPEKAREKIRRWLQNNPQKAREHRKKWRRNNKDKLRVYFHNRRVRIRDNGGSFSVQEWQDLVKQTGGVCLCCGLSENVKALTIDHVVPLYHGGSNDIDNLQPLCRPCNSSKGTKIIDYRRYGTQTMHDWVENLPIKIKPKYY